MIKLLAEEQEAGSVAGRIYRAWELDRQLIKECHEAMAYGRSLQVTFNNIVGATRFKTFEGSQLAKTICQNKDCGAVDSWEHFQECYRIPKLNGSDRKTRVAEIVEICKRAEVPNPVRPKPSTEQYSVERDQQ